MTNLKYDNYPQDCPPSNAIEFEGDFFRFCDEEVPTKTDFLTHVDLNLNFPEAKICEAKALSFYDTLESAKKMQRRYPRLRKKKIIKVVIENSFGIGEIHEHHLNLWEYFGLNIFDLVKEQLEEVS